WNCRGFRPNFEELKSLCFEYRPEVICLQEIYLRQSDKRNIRGYTSYHISSISSDDRPIGGSSILIDNSVPHQRISLSTPLQAVAARVSLVRTISICSIYLPPALRFSRQDLVDLVEQLPSPFLLLGDFNAHSDLWGDQSLDRSGTEVENFIDISNLSFK
ncbi:hypothetical protein CAPTEDRAFT_116911, partial [Capitella teleta]